MTMSKTYTAFDVETTGFLRFEGDRIFSYVITDYFGNSKVYDVPFENGEWENHPNWLYLKEYFADTSIVKIGHNIRFDVGFVRANGIEVPEHTEIHDTMIMSQMLQNLADSHALDVLAEQVYKYKASKDNEVEKIARKLRMSFKKHNPDSRIHLSQYQHVPKDVMHRYQIEDGERAMLLYRAFLPKLQAVPEMWLDYLNEMEFIFTAIKQEEYGMLIDWKQADKLLAWMSGEVSEAKSTIQRIAGKEINPNSPKQLTAYLTQDLGYKIESTTESGKTSVGKDVIYDLYKRHKHPALEALLKLKAYEKGYTNISSYKDLSHPETHVIHFNKNTNPARTGRQSVSNPNLQNMSTEVSNNAIYRIPSRRCFICRPNSIMYYVDYSGIELRLIAGLAGEQEFIDAFHNKTDPHGMTAPVLYGDNWAEVCAYATDPEITEMMQHIIHSSAVNKNDAAVQELKNRNAPKWMYTACQPERYNFDFSTLKSQMRTGTKVFNFGIGYGGAVSAVTLELIGLDNAQKARGHANYCKRWPHLAYFTPNTIKEVRDNGYITTAFGRRLWVSRSKAFCGANYKVQGTAAGILKRAENRVAAYCHTVLEDKMNIIVSIHDEINSNCDRSIIKYQDYYLNDISRLMTIHKEIKVPLEVEWKHTTTHWAAKTKTKFKTPDDYEFGKFHL